MTGRDDDDQPLELTAHIVAEDPRYPMICVNGPFIFGLRIDPKTGDVDPKRRCICFARYDSECICTL